jgi:hypothetical protein
MYLVRNTQLEGQPSPLRTGLSPVAFLGPRQFFIDVRSEMAIVGLRRCNK